MDIYRKELNEIYAAQGLEAEALPECVVTELVNKANGLAELTGRCIVITDIAHDSSMFIPGELAGVMGLSGVEASSRFIDSSDEDFLYSRMHPEDLVDLRMLEYDFFSKIDRLPAEEKRRYKAVAEIRMDDGNGGHVLITKSTQVAALSPAGKMWLMLCGYDLSSHPSDTKTTDPRIICVYTGKVHRLSLGEKRGLILTQREKEILMLIKEGHLSKEIAGILNISLNTVNRHRQNILGKLSVDNSMEAVNAAIAMRLL